MEVMDHKDFLSPMKVFEQFYVHMKKEYIYIYFFKYSKEPLT